MPKTIRRGMVSATHHMTIQANELHGVPHHGALCHDGVVDTSIGKPRGIRLHRRQPIVTKDGIAGLHAARDVDDQQVEPAGIGKERLPILLRVDELVQTPDGDLTDECRSQLIEQIPRNAELLKPGGPVRPALDIQSPILVACEIQEELLPGVLPAGATIPTRVPTPTHRHPPPSPCRRLRRRSRRDGTCATAGPGTPCSQGTRHRGSCGTRP